MQRMVVPELFGPVEHTLRRADQVAHKTAKMYDTQLYFWGTAKWWRGES